MFNNFPALTHYMQQTKQHRTVQSARKHQSQSAGSDVDEKADGRPGSAVMPTHHRHTSFMHDNDEWSDLNQADTAVPMYPVDSTAFQQVDADKRVDEVEQADRTMAVFPPRTFGHLLQLPFLASYLEPVIREATEAADERRAQAAARAGG